MSSRYYAAEATVWLLGAVLLVCRFIGIAPGQAFPILNVVPVDERLFPRAVGFLIVAAAVYMVIEWKQSSREARNSIWPIIRIVATLTWTVSTLWISWSLIVRHSPYEGVSPAWYLGFIVLGLLIGTFVSILLFSALMIRTQSEAKRLRLPRIPIAARAQFFIWTPAIVMLAISYYLLIRLAPSVVTGLAFPLFLIPFLALLGEGLASLALARDSDGNRIPFAKRVARFKEIHDSHDYANFLIDHGEEIIKEIGTAQYACPKDIQKAMQERFARRDGAVQTFHFHVQQQEESQILFYPKDGNPDNLDPENRGVTITKSGLKKGLLRILVIPDSEDEQPREMEISVALIESYAEEYISTHSKQEDLNFRKIFSYAINQTVISAMMDQAGPLLHWAANTGQIDIVRQLVQQDDVNVNEKAAFGWTALLAASAQGYPDIARLLLEAGANPDLGNLQGITPLIYSARYGNTDICAVLLEYGAELDLQDIYGMTALIIATRDGHQSIVDLLLKAGANPTAKTGQGMTALDFAYAGKHGKIAKTLRQANKPIDGNS